MLLRGRPVLMHTIEAFNKSDYNPEIIVVLNVDFHQYWENLCLLHNFSIPHKLVKGGTQRFDSVKNGIKAIQTKAIVAIHDAVRPLLSKQLIDRTFEEAERSGNAVAAIKSRDSVRQNTGTHTIPLDREEIYLIQTPQTFSSEILKKAYTQEYRNEFTDDASVAEKIGIKINLIDGETRNFKITFPEDIRLAEIYLDP